MKQWIAGALCAALSTLAGMPALAERPTAEDFEKKYAREIAHAAETGLRMRRLDRAAWVATDEVTSRDSTAMQDQRMRGYIVDESGDVLRVLFVGMAGNALKAIYEVAVDQGEVVKNSYRKYPEGRDLTKHQAGLYAALDTARNAWMKEKLLHCAENVNAIVLRHEGDAPERKGYRVYLNSATTTPDVIIAGGHHRVELNDTADKVVSIHSFTNSCLNFSQEAATKDSAVAFAAMTHVQAAHPEEIHVFLSLNYGLPFIIITIENGVGWKVDGGKINAEILPDGDGKKASQ